jgi:hypothetical protein
VCLFTKVLVHRVSALRGFCSDRLQVQALQLSQWLASSLFIRVDLLLSVSRDGVRLGLFQNAWNVSSILSGILAMSAMYTGVATFAFLQ